MGPGLPNGNTDFQVMLSVPEGKIAVIEHVSAEVTTGPDTVPRVTISTVAFVPGHYVQLNGVTAKQADVEYRVFLASHPIKLYAPPGGQVTCRLEAVTSAGADLLVSGYYVPAE